MPLISNVQLFIVLLLVDPFFEESYENLWDENKESAHADSPEVVLN